MHSRTLTIGAMLVVAGLLLFVGVYNSNLASTVDSSAHASVGGAATKNSAPDFTLSKLDGGTISLSEFKGKKPVVLDFWASWCPNCRRDMPMLSRFYEKYKDKVEVIGINLREKESTVKDFIASSGVSFPIALDPFGQVANTYGIQYTNTHFLIDIDGNFVRTIPGDIREADILSLIGQGGSLDDQTYLPDKEPCQIAYLENPQEGESVGVCTNS